MKNDFIKKFIVKGIEKDLEEETKKDIKKISSKGNYTKKIEKLTAEELTKKAENIIYIMVRQKIKYLSKSMKKALKEEDTEKVVKLESRKSAIMQYITLLEKEKLENRNGMLYSLFNNHHKQKNGYSYENSEDYNDLKGETITLLYDYNRKHDKKIVLKSKMIFFKILNKISYMYQKKNIINNNSYSLDAIIGNSKNDYYNYVSNYEVQEVGIVENPFSKMNATEKNIYILKKDGFTFKEISKKLGINENTIKTLFYRLKLKA